MSFWGVKIRYEKWRNKVDPWRSDICLIDNMNYCCSLVNLMKIQVSVLERQPEAYPF